MGGVDGEGPVRDRGDGQGKKTCQVLKTRSVSVEQSRRRARRIKHVVGVMGVKTAAKALLPKHAKLNLHKGRQDHREDSRPG